MSENKPLMRAMQEKRRSNATQPKPKRTIRKQRSRSGSRKAAVEEGR